MGRLGKGGSSTATIAADKCTPHQQAELLRYYSKQDSPTPVGLPFLTWVWKRVSTCFLMRPWQIKISYMVTLGHIVPVRNPHIYQLWICPNTGIMYLCCCFLSFPLFTENFHSALRCLARLNPYHLRHCWKLSDALAAHVPFTSLHSSCTKRENDVVSRGAIDLLVLFQYKPIHFKTGINLHIISLKIKWSYLLWLQKWSCWSCT